MRRSRLAIRVISREYPDRPENEELENIAGYRRTFVKNPRLSDYDGMFEVGKEIPRGFRHRRSNDLSAIILFFLMVAMLFLGIVTILGTLL